MKLTEHAEEILETLWVHTQELKESNPFMGLSHIDPAVEELSKWGYLRLTHNQIGLTDKGRKEGERIVRRHRLAERLFADVLDVKKKLVHPLSCRMEHLLHEGVEDNICTLLGHPKTCPHGRSIPPGNCCKKFKDQVGKLVIPLSKLKPHEKARVSYLEMKDSRKFQKLMAMGVLPGMTITLIHKFPSFVFQIGQSQFAIDKELANCIWTRRNFS